MGYGNVISGSFADAAFMCAMRHCRWNGRFFPARTACAMVAPGLGDAIRLMAWDWRGWWFDFWRMARFGLR